MKPFKLIHTLIPAALLLTVATACTADNDLLTEPRTVALRFRLSDESPEAYEAERSRQEVDTRAPGWSTFANAYILVYDAGGKCIAFEYYATVDNNKVSIDVPEGANYTVYAIANAGAGLFTAATTKDELIRAEKTLTAWDDIEQGSHIVMTGWGNLPKVVYESDEPIQYKLPLYRLAARLNITLTKAANNDGVAVTGIRLVNLPTRTYYIHRAITGEADDTETNATRPDDDAVRADTKEHWIDKTPDKAVAFDTPVTYYMFENRAGINDTISNQQYKRGEKVDARATYLEITGNDTHHSTLVWHIYLGGNNLGNYNVKRNNTYTLSVALRYNEFDARIVQHDRRPVTATPTLILDGEGTGKDTFYGFGGPAAQPGITPVGEKKMGSTDYTFD